MALDPNISLGVRPLQVPDPLAQMAQVSQIQSAQRQGEISRMQLEDLKNDRIEMQQFQSQLAANGGNANLDELAKTMLKTPKLFAQGVELTKKLKEQADFERYGRKLFPELFDATAPAGMPAAPVNALAPNAAPTAAPVNALAAPASEPYPGYNQAIGMTPSAAPARAQQLSSSGKTRQQLEGEIYMAQKNPLFKGLAETAKLELAEMMRAPVYHNVPGVGLVNPITKEVVMAAKAAPPAPPVSIAEFERAKTDPAFMKFLQDRAAATRAPVQPVAPTVTTVEDPNNPGKFLQVDARQYRGGGAGAPGVIGGARPSALSEKTATQKVQMGKDINQAIFELKDAAKDGGLIDISTGSGAGRLYDIGAGFFGNAPKGAIATGQLAPIADLVLKMVPRFEGPQSDKDTQSYKAAAGQLADSSLPTEIRKAAAKEIIRLMEARKNQFGSADMAAPAGGGVDTNNPLLK
jgi:hypothetical protein